MTDAECGKEDRASGPARRRGLSSLRILSCLGIAALHTVNAAEILYRGELSAFADTVSLAVSNCLRWAVPCFVMITGALLLDPERELTARKIYGKYLLRVLSALVLFSFIYRFFSLAMNGEALTLQVFGEVLLKIVTADGWAHLWYLYVLTGLYLLLPFYRMITRAAADREILLLLLIYGLFVSVFPLLQLFGLRIGFSIPVISIYPFYLFAGYAFSRGMVRLPKPAAVIVIAVTEILLILAVFGNGDGRFSVLLSYSSVPVVLQACALFSVFSGESGKSGRFDRVIWAADRCCFGIYLVHMIFLRLFLRYWTWDPYRVQPVLSMTGIAALVFLLSFLVTWILKKYRGSADFCEENAVCEPKKAQGNDCTAKKTRILY